MVELARFPSLKQLNFSPRISSAEAACLYSKHERALIISNVSNILSIWQTGDGMGPRTKPWRCGRLPKAWKEKLEGNPMSFEKIYEANQPLDVSPLPGMERMAF